VDTRAMNPPITMPVTKKISSRAHRTAGIIEEYMAS
jgi:hypothetical protein